MVVMDKELFDLLIEKTKAGKIKWDVINKGIHYETKLTVNETTHKIKVWGDLIEIDDMEFITPLARVMNLYMLINKQKSEELLDTTQKLIIKLQEL